MSAVGFDVGNENSYVAAVISGGIEILDNEYSLRATPTYVAFTETSRNVGIGAKAKVVSNLENTIFGFKPILGKKRSDEGVEKEWKYLPTKLTFLPNGDAGFQVKYLKNCVAFSTTQIMAMMLTKLKIISESKAGNRIFDCVIAVPDYYTDAQRRAMLDAAKIADLNPLRLMNESSAVALPYGFYKTGLQDDHPLNVIFIDIGHSMTTVSACAFSKEKLKVLGTVWDGVGGRDFDNALVKHFADEFKEKYKIDVFSNKKALMTMMLECESLKRQMSVNSLQLVMNIECFIDDLDVQGRMRRSHFEILSAPLLARIKNTIQTALSKAKITAADVHAVELVGGSTRIPAVKQLIHQIFGQEPNCSLNQDEAVARGCALQCALLSPALKARAFIIEDAPSYDIQVTWKNMQSEVEELSVFSGYYEVPVYRKITFPMNRPFSVNVYQIDRLSLARVKIGSFSFDNFPETVENSYPLVLAKACVNIHGIFTIISAKLVVQSVKWDVIALPDKDEDIKKVSEEDAMDTNDASTQTSNVVETFPLSVTSHVPTLSQKDLAEFIEIEKQMIKRYLEENEKADARNALEEYIYELRSKINDEFKEFVQDKDRNGLLDYLNKQETWVFESVGQNVREFTRKVKESEELFQPIFRRYREWEERPRVVERFQEALQNALDQIEEVATAEKICSYCEDVRKLQEIYRNARHLYNNSVSSFANLKKCEDTTVTTEYLRKCLSEFQGNFQKKYAELKSKIDLSSVPSEQQYGDGKSAEEENAARDYPEKHP